MIATIYITLFLVFLVIAILGLLIKEHRITLMGLSALGFIMLSVLIFSSGIEFRTGSTVVNDTEIFSYTQYSDINTVLGFITIGLALALLIVSWKQVIENKEEKYLEVQ